MEAYEHSEGDQARRRIVMERITSFFLQPDLETRAAFDELVVEHRRVLSALQECTEFIDRMEKLKIRYTAEENERVELTAALKRVQFFCMVLEQMLQGSDDPDIRRY
jgi:hypothetical protein